MRDIGGKIRDSGWLQGRLVPVSLLDDLVAPEHSGEGKRFLLAVTQSCDLVHHCAESEPHGVFLVLREIEKLDPAFASGLNPRRIHFESGGQVFEANAWEQVTVGRAELAGREVSSYPRLADDLLGMIVRWLGKRFTRAAFPDAFNNRLAGVSRKFKNAIKNKQHLFSELLLRVDPFREVSKAEIYEVVLFLIMSEEDFADKGKLEKANEAASRLEGLLGKCEGIKVVECQAVSEGDLTLAEFKMMLGWDYDYLTYREDLES